MSQKYHAIVHDEVLYWFDILQNNTIDNISKITKVHRDKVRKILDEKYPIDKDFLDKPDSQDKQYDIPTTLNGSGIPCTALLEVPAIL